jgi:hypothetical protein
VPVSALIRSNVVKLANAAVDKARRWAWNEARQRRRPEKGPLGRSRTMSTPEGWIKQTRWALLASILGKIIPLRF